MEDLLVKNGQFLAHLVLCWVMLCIIMLLCLAKHVVIADYMLLDNILVHLLHYLDPHSMSAVHLRSGWTNHT